MSKLRLTHLVLTLATTLPFAHAQTSAAPPPAPPEAKLPAYDVYTIKPNNTGSRSSGSHGRGDSFSATNISLNQLLQLAFSIRQDAISGLSGPIDGARFDIEAKVVDPDLDAIHKLTREQRGAMLMPMLTERFHLKTHYETRIAPVYELVVIPAGPKFKPTTSDAKGPNTSINGRNDHTDLTATNLTMKLFSEILSTQVPRPIIDKTSLTGSYDLKLQWSREDSSSSDTDPAPSIFTALPEQLGLKLQPAKGPVQTLVVDHVEMPSEN